jgi:hypothetical protein
MKKKEIQKLVLSRETLRHLEKSHLQTVVGGMSVISWCRPWGDETDDCGDTYNETC